MKRIISSFVIILLLTNNVFALNLSRVKTWNTNNILTASDLNAEFNNILNHSISNSDVASNAAIVASKLDQSVAGAIGATTPNTGAFTTLSSTGATTLGDAAGDTVHFNANTITLEGATADDYETTIAVTDPTADRTITFPNHTGTVAVSGAAFDLGSFALTAETLISDVATGTAPFTVSSTTKVTNLNADTLDGYNTATTSTASSIYVSDTSGYLPDATVDTGALKTATGEVNGAGNFVLSGGSYGFYPQIHSDGSNSNAWQIASGFNTGTYTTNIYHSAAQNYSQQRYVTSSGQDHWLFLLIDKVTKDIIGIYSAPDAPHYGNGGDYNKVPHPFGNYDPNLHEIILVDKETIAELKSKVTEDRSLAKIVNEEYCVNKAEIYIPLHSGKYLTKDNKQVMELVETIPDYIKCKSLRKMTAGELQVKAQKQEQIKQKSEQEKQKKAQDKISAENKLKALGLSDSELEALRD